MSIDLVRQELNAINALIENRKRVANIVLADKNLVKELVFLTFLVDDKISIKAAWILEWICTHNSIELVLPYLKEFTNNISHLRFDGAIRPCAKICEHLATAKTSKTKNLVQEELTESHINKIIETGFDWLLTPQKIAVKAYAMNTLYLFGLQRDWIHPELKNIISTKIIHENKNTKARGKQILTLIEKHQKRTS